MIELFWIGQIEPDFCESCLRQLRDARGQGDEIRIYFASKGGRSDLGVMLYDALRVERARLSIVAGGIVASAGITVLCAANQERRLSYPNTQFMIHDLCASVKGELSEAERELELLKWRQKEIDEVYRKEFNYDGLREYNAQKNLNWFNTKTALEFSLIGKIQ